jgi:hypothetical protein
MKLSEITPDYRLLRRAAWGNPGYLIRMVYDEYHDEWRFEGVNPIAHPYVMTYEDAVADDWELA